MGALQPFGRVCHDTHAMRRAFRLFAGLLLIPACIALSLAIWDLVRQIPSDSAASAPSTLIALALGYGVWLAVFFLLPLPVRTYIFAHELTHALWGLASGASVQGVDVKRHRGSCRLSELTTLTLLSPYFFPLYTILLCALYGLLSLFLPMAPYRMLWLFMIGFTWGFHFTFTLTSLMQRQTDIAACGHLFAYTFIYAANVAGIGLWLVAATPLTLRDWAVAVGGGSAQVCTTLGRRAVALHDAAWSLRPPGATCPPTQ